MRMPPKHVLVLAIVLTFLFLSTPLVGSDRVLAQGPIRWQEGSPVPGGDTVSAFARDPQDPNRLWLATAGELSTGLHTYLYRTDDGGRHWATMDGGLPDACDYGNWGLAVQADGRHLALTGCTQGGLWLSDDGGFSWHASLEGTTVYWIRFSPAAQDLYATVQAGDSWQLLRSGDGGSSWRRADAGLPAGFAELGFDPTDPQTIYTGYYASAQPIWRSKDGGLSWQPLPAEGLPAEDGTYGQCVSPVTVGPADGSLWVVLSRANFLGGCDPDAEGRIFRSTDDGATWSQVLDHLWSYAPVIDPSDPATMYLVTRTDGLYRSVDAGDSWQRQGPWPGSDQRYDTPDLAVDWHDRSKLYATPHNAGHPMYVSQDQGRNWVTIDPPSDINPGPIRVHPAGGLLASGGGSVYRSADGYTWQMLDQALPPRQRVTALATNPADGTQLYAGAAADWDGTKQLVWRSNDAGRTWAPAASGTDGRAEVVSLLVDPGQPQTVYATLANVGVGDPPDPLRRSSDGGRTWQPAGVGLSGRPGDLVHDGSAVYVATDAGIYKSTNRGQTWAATSTILSNASINSIHAALAVRGGVIHAAVTGLDSEGNIVENRIVRSADGGLSWQPAVDYPADISSGRLIVAGDGLYLSWSRYEWVSGTSVSEEGLLRSTDGGQTWLPFATPDCSDLVAASPDEGLFFSIRGGALLRAGTGGQSWAASGTGLRGGHTVSALAALGDTVYAGTANGELFKSADRGGSWEYLPLQLNTVNYGSCSTSNRISQLEIRQSNPPRVYVGMQGFCGAYGGGGNGLFSTDDGTTWQHPIASGCVQEIAFSSADPQTTWVLMEDDGIVRIANDGSTERLTLPGVYHYGLAVHPHNPDVMLASVTGDPCLYRSIDGGSTWDGVQSKSPLCTFSTAIEEIAFNEYNPNQVYADTFVSSDEGMSWQPSATAAHAFRFAPADPLRAYSLNNSTGRLQRSKDGGQTWRSVGAWPIQSGSGQGEVTLQSTIGWAEVPRIYAYGCDVARTCYFWSASDTGFNTDYSEVYLPILLR